MITPHGTRNTPVVLDKKALKRAFKSATRGVLVVTARYMSTKEETISTLERLGMPIDKVIHWVFTDWGQKGRPLKRALEELGLADLHAVTAVVDDNPGQLDSVRAALPHVNLFLLTHPRVAGLT